MGKEVPMDQTQSAYVGAARSAVTLVAHPSVGERWDQPSALTKMSVGALASHLANQVISTRAALNGDAGRGREPPISLLDHYRRVKWAQEGLDDEANIAIREQAAEAAADGHAALAYKVAAALDQVASALTGEELPVVVRMPWWDWSLSLDDFLVTRMMEIAVHSDDLAVSVEVPTPDLPDAVIQPVLHLLVRVSTRRHGQPAVLRALSRSERAPDSIAAF